MNDSRSLPQIARQVGKIICVELGAALILAACNGTEPAATVTNASAPVTQAQVDGTVHVCTSCHGFAGRSVSPNFPILAGQQAGYIEAQLKAFRDHQRADRNARTYMWGMAAHSSDAMFHEIALYFSSQKPGVSAPDTQAAIAAGERSFARAFQPRRFLLASLATASTARGWDQSRVSLASTRNTSRNSWNISPRTSARMLSCVPMPRILARPKSRRSALMLPPNRLLNQLL